MENRIKKMYFRDCGAIFFFMTALWIVLTYVMTRVNHLAPNHIIKITILLVGTMACTLGTAALIAVVVHLRKNRTELYTEDIVASMKSNNNE